WTLVSNIVLGVTEGYTKKLEIVGTGFRVTATGTDLEFALGFSHPVVVKAPEGITFTVESPSTFSVGGIDTQQLGQLAAKIRGSHTGARGGDTGTRRWCAGPARLASDHG